LEEKKSEERVSYQIPERRDLLLAGLFIFLDPMAWDWACAEPA
jgi:hypothetical protein